MAILTFPMNLIGCGLNDIYDYESDRRSPRAAPFGHRRSQRIGRSFAGCIAMMPVVVRVHVAQLGQFCHDRVARVRRLAVFGSAERLKERPPLDSLANGIGYFLLPFAMGYSLGADIRTMPMRYYFLACACGVHALATAADYEADRAAGHRTIAVVVGRRAAAAGACSAFDTAGDLGICRCPAVRGFMCLLPQSPHGGVLFPRGA